MNPAFGPVEACSLTHPHMKRRLMRASNDPGNSPMPLEPAYSGYAPADRFPRVRTRKGLRIVARIVVVTVTLGLAGLSGILATELGASGAGQVASQDRDATQLARVAAR
jgi:hypothetical protein